jgi:hypothetical protein
MATKAKKKKKIVRKRAVAGVKRTVVKTKRKSLLDQGNAVIRKIERMEARYLKTKGKEAKELLAMAINGEHLKLDLIKNQMKNKS